MISFPRWPRGSRANAAESGDLSDTRLLQLFEDDPSQAWQLFLERYAGYLLGVLRHMGFDDDGAMDRFVYICEKLSEQNFRRLRSVRFVGQRGELKPWLRTVVRRLSVNWAWSQDGRRRLFESIRRLPELHRRIFELHFWRGLPPSEVLEHLRSEGVEPIDLVAVLEALEEIFEHLDSQQRWRLMSRLARHRRAIPVAAEDPDMGTTHEPADRRESPEDALLRQERLELTEQALGHLEPRARLILQLRYEESLSLAEVAELTQLSVSGVKKSLRVSRQRLRQSLDALGFGGVDHA